MLRIIFICAILFGAAWQWPGSTAGALLGWAGVILLAFTCLRSINYRQILALGTIAHIAGFYWIAYTVKEFGAFSPLVAGLIFLLFAITFSLQFPLFLFFYRQLPKSLDAVALRFPLAWVSTEVLFFHIFPWQIAHTQLGFSHFVQIADFGGVRLVSFVMAWLASAFALTCYYRKARLLQLAPAITSFALTLFYGWQSLNDSRWKSEQEVSVALLQANVSIEEKHNVKFFGDNTARYRAMSKRCF